MASLSAADTDVERGRALGRHGDTAGAVAAFKDALKSEPEHSGANLGLGIASMELGHTRAAVRAFRSSATAAPQNPATLYNLGLALDKLAQSCKPTEAKKMLLEAEIALTASCALDPNSADSFCQLGVVLLRVGKPIQAVEAFEKALKLDPHHQAASDNICTFEAAHMARPTAEALDAALNAESAGNSWPPTVPREAWSDTPAVERRGAAHAPQESTGCFSQALEDLLLTGEDLEF
eukprot:TRINITY_DN44259_c0_g1_i1.p1 TRINITY_DN44259_c0_g1~~TRINITY_DN44259_c0_g1_i1.p1  ORF type:complete len:236 (-),score=52.76 TRINITY_DN44259_c0_g1_i1:52-759(-)